MSFWSIFPKKDELLNWFEKHGDGKVRLVNAHMHTPHSFSAFQNIPQALDMALAENVKVVGINDFYTTNGYSEWATGCAERKIFPLFNIEYISLNRDDQSAGIKVNDPNNPGRTYLSGKGLSFPPQSKEPFASKLASVLHETNLQVEQMCTKLNEVLSDKKIRFTLEYKTIQTELTKGMVRERHLAKALREKITAHYQTAEEQKEIYHSIFGGKDLKSDIGNFAAIENEIRGNLLKAGGAAFIAESPEAFLDMTEVCEMLLQAGGIPTYPFLADDANGNFTDFEAPKERVLEILKERNICSIEFITTRNSLAVLEEYASYFKNNGLVVTFGSEHNTPAMEPIELFARHSTPLSPLLLEINYEGACITAAHQYLMATEGKGYVSIDGKPALEKRDEFAQIGKALIEYLIKN
jgi:hypothetical protein